MNPELQSVVDRLELVERQARGWKLLVVLSVLLAAAALVAPLLRPSAPAIADRARHSVVEAHRFILRDLEDRVAGGMEVGSDGGLKLVLGGGYGTMGAAFMEVQRNGVVHLTLRGPDGGVRAALLATRTPALSLSSDGQHSGAVVMSRDDGAGSIVLSDPLGRVRFKAP